jgi:uroporphyrinogen-III synthase
VVEVTAYESRCPHQLDPQILLAQQAKAVDVVTFANSKTVQNFCQLLSQAAGDDWLSWLTGVKITSIGPQTSKTCQESLGRVDIEASEHTLEGLTQTIVGAHCQT